MAEEFDVQLTPSLYAGGYNISCNGANTGSINLFISGGTAPYTYVWLDGPTVRNRSNLIAGYYRVVVTNSNGQSITREITLTEPEPFEAVLIPSVYEGNYNISQNGGDNGSILAEIHGGVPPYSFLWSNGQSSEQIENLIAGSYTLTVHDATNCIASQSVTLIEPTSLHIVSITSPKAGSSIYNTSCDKNDGSINLQVAGGTPPYLYEWTYAPIGSDNFTDFSAVQNPQGAEAGQYKVRIFDENRTFVDGSITLTSSPKVTATITPFIYPNSKNTSCNVCNNGIITLSNLTGITPYTYNWNSGQSTQNISSLAQGFYSVTITDALGCSTLKESDIIAPEREDWTMNGNTGTNPATQYIGTSDNKDLVFKANNSETMRLLSNGGTQFTGDVKISNTSGKSGMLFMDSNGKLINSEVDPQAPSCGHGSYPIWNTNQQDNIVFTCVPTKVGIGTTSFPNGSAFHVSGNSLLDGNIEIGNSVDNFDLKVNGTAQITTLAGGGTASLVQTDNDGLLSKVAFPTKADMNYWNLSATTEINYFGKVGINTSSFPGGEDFHVSGKSLFNGDAIFNNDVKINSFTNSTSELVMVDGAKKLFNAPVNSIMSEVNYWKTNNNGTDLFHTAGKVGIGTDEPHAQLQVGNSVTSVSLGSFWNGSAPEWTTNYIGFNAARDEEVQGNQKWTLNGANQVANAAAVIASDLSGQLRFITIPQDASTPEIVVHKTDATILSNERMIIRNDGKVGIGNPVSYPAGYSLYVGTGIITEKLKIAQGASAEWMDKVFDSDYKLRSLIELEEFISINKHLPEIPTTKEVQKDGIDVGSIEAKLLQKVEELTLYVIQISNENNALRERIESIEKLK